MLKVLIYLVETGNCRIFVSVKEVLNQVPICIGKKKSRFLPTLIMYIYVCLMKITDFVLVLHYHQYRLVVQM